MIRLQAKPTVSEETVPVRDLPNLIMEPVTLVTGQGMKGIVLTQNADLAEYLNTESGLMAKIESEGVFHNGGWRVLRRHAVPYHGGLIAHDCLAIKMACSPLFR
jgi:nitrogen PTS system EIIA component